MRRDQIIISCEKLITPRRPPLYVLSNRLPESATTVSPSNIFNLMSPICGLCNNNHLYATFSLQPTFFGSFHKILVWKMKISVVLFANSYEYFFSSNVVLPGHLHCWYAIEHSSTFDLGPLLNAPFLCGYLAQRMLWMAKLANKLANSFSTWQCRIYGYSDNFGVTKKVRNSFNF